MELLPIFLNIKGRQCLIVGGGELAFRKATLLDKASASVKFVANEFSENIESLANKKNFPLIKDSFKDKYLEDIVLVIAATNCKETNTLTNTFFIIIIPLISSDVKYTYENTLP